MPITRNHIGYTADQYVYFCPQCERCWEFYESSHRRIQNRQPCYLDNFPSFGKERRVCQRCREG